MKLYYRRFVTAKHCWHFLQTLLYNIIAICLINLLISVIYQNHSDYLLKSLKGPIEYDDPEFIQYIRERILEAPSTEPYNILHHARFYKMKSEQFYDHYSKIIFQNERNGFFIEAGALDGQAMSNTLHLEMKQGWTGLLVEPDPANYISLKGKHRKAWTAKACLSMYTYPKKEKLSSFDIVSDNHKYKDVKHRSMGSIIQDTENKGLTNDETANSYYESQCIPLGSFLVALNVSRVDLFSLDVEFVEEQVIRNFDFKRFDVQVLYMEWWEHDKLLWLNDFMAEKGFIFAGNKMGDIIFVKNNTEYHRRVAIRYPERRLTIYKYVPPPIYNGSKTIKLVV